jgi:hypothetical protein
VPAHVARTLTARIGVTAVTPDGTAEPVTKPPVNPAANVGSEDEPVDGSRLRSVLFKSADNDPASNLSTGPATRFDDRPVEKPCTFDERSVKNTSGANVAVSSFPRAVSSRCRYSPVFGLVLNPTSKISVGSGISR